jgi:hypothetical protein
MTKNLFKTFIKNVKNPIFGFLTISLKGFCIKTARDNDVKPFTLNTTTNAKKEIMPNHFTPEVE